MSELPVYQAQKPATDQGDSDSAANANFGSIRFGDIHEYGTDYAAEKCPGKYFHWLD